MQWLRSIWRNLFRKHAVESILDDELRSYKQLLEDEKVAAGADSEIACREAAIELGGIEVIKEQVRDIRRGALLEGIGTELRQSIRALRRNPGMTGMCVLMLALGIGASTVIFSVFEAALLRPLPFRDSSRLVELHETWLSLGIEAAAFSEADFWDLHDRAQAFEHVAAIHGGDEANLTGDGQPEKVSAPHVTIDLFRTLGVAPIFGRDFSASDDHANVAILGNKFWKARYKGDPNILGKVLRLHDKSYTVIGVLPSGEPWLDSQVYLPFPHHPNADRSSREYDVIGRLAPGITPEAAKNELQGLAASLAALYPNDDKSVGFNFLPSRVWVAPESTAKALRFLLVAVGLLVLIACVNVANLLLSRGLARQREIAVRTALGAGRARLVRFIMLESLLLSASGAILGLALAAVCVRVLHTVEIRGVPRLDEVSLNLWVLAFTFGVTLLTGLLCGLAPAFQTPVEGIASALREGDRQAGASRRQGRLRSILVAAEVALAFLLLVGTGLIVRSFQGLLNERRGFETAHRLLFSVSYPEGYYQNGRGKEFVDRFLQTVSANPNVMSSGAVNARPVEGPNFGMGIDAVSHSSGSGSPPWAGWRVITPGYLPVVGLSILHGRNFDKFDKPVWAEPGQPQPSRRTVILSSALAKLLFAKEDPIGKHALLWKGQSGGFDAEVVGVASDSLERGLDHPPALTVYLPYGRVGVPSEFILRTHGDPMSIVPVVRAVVRQLDPNLPLGNIRNFDEVVSRSVSSQRMNSVVLIIFSGFALLLASLGIYGVLSYSVGRRTSEIGLRMALGASQSGILSMTVGQGLVPAFLGIAVGGVLAAWLSRYLKSLLFGVEPFDLPIYAAVALLLLVAAAIACLVPGRRAMRTDPATALRLE